MIGFVLRHRWEVLDCLVLAVVFYLTKLSLGMLAVAFYLTKLSLGI